MQMHTVALSPWHRENSPGIKVANDRRETDKNTMVFAGKVLVRIYHYSLNNPISEMKRRLETLINSDFNKYTIMLLDSVEFLIHVDDWIENQG